MKLSDFNSNVDFYKLQEFFFNSILYLLSFEYIKSIPPLHLFSFLRLCNSSMKIKDFFILNENEVKGAKERSFSIRVYSPLTS